MSTALVVLMVALVAVVVAVLLAVVWWSSGRARAGDPKLAARARADAESTAMKQYRPNNSAPLGPLG